MYCGRMRACACQSSELCLDTGSGLLACEVEAWHLVISGLCRG